MRVEKLTALPMLSQTLCALLLSVPVLGEEPVVWAQLLDNGDFAQVPSMVQDAQGSVPIPWWRTARGRTQLERESQGLCLRTGPGEWAEQPIAAYAPLIERLRVKGEVRGQGRILLRDGRGEEYSFEYNTPDWTPLEIQAQATWMPRLLLRLESSQGGSAYWRGLRAEVALPCPSEADLAKEVAQCLDRIIAPWLERALDEAGPRRTAFVSQVIDAVDGSTLYAIPGGFHPLWEQLWHAQRAAPHPRWKQATERFLEDYLELGLHPQTGLPRGYDPRADQGLDDKPVEIALPLGFLIDVARLGEGPLAARARAAALRIGETVLANGILPDGGIAASYFPSDARVNTGIVALRSLDVPAQLGRLSQLSGDPRWARAAGEALAHLEFTHAWSGTWDSIDPAFDDEYGHYGARAVVLANHLPEDPFYRRFVLDAFAHFAPLWRDALRLGGNVAADQVRCWVLLSEQRDFEADGAALRDELLADALRSHFKGQQYGDGAWGDVTIYRFNPNANLQVGDYSGAPMNLLHGLAALYGQPKFRTAQVRGMYTAVLRSSIQAYERPYGFLMERRQREGANPAAGSLRMMLGLSKWLRAVAPSGNESPTNHR